MHILVYVSAIFVALLAMPSACSLDPVRAKKVLEHNGVSDVQVTGYRWFGCGHGDTFRTGWKGVSAQGKAVGGCVGCGWLKGCTVRFDE